MSQQGFKQVVKFNTTRWSVVLRAGGDRTESRDAFGQLAADYWYPLYAFLRRKGMGAQDAEDLIQSFFAWLMESQLFAKADAERGRLRSFLITALMRYRTRELRDQNTLKRRPDGAIVSIDRELGDSRYRAEPVDELSPDKLYEKTWALTVVRRAMQKLREESERQGNASLFSLLEGFLTGQKTHSGREVAEQTGMTEAAVRAATYRLKQRYVRLLREEVADTVDSEDDVDPFTSPPA